MLKAESAADQTLMEWLMAEEASADLVREPYMEQQRETTSFYMNYRQQPLPQGLEWMSGELLADSFLLIESLLPNIAQSVFGGKSVSVNAYSMAGTQINKAMDKLLMKLRRNAAFEHEAIPSIRMAGVTGHQNQKNIWVEEWGTKRVPIMSGAGQDAFGQSVKPRIVDYEYHAKKVFAGPKSFYPDNQKIWKSVSKNMLGEPLVWIEEMSQNLDYMKEVDRDYQAEHGVPFYRNLDQLDYGHRTQLARSRDYSGNAGYMNGSRQLSATEQISGLSDIQLMGHNSIWMKHAWAQVPRHIKDYEGDPQQRLIVYTADGIILRDVPMPTWNMKAPFHDIKFMQIGNEAYGRTPLYWALPEIEQRSEMRNLRLAEAWLNIFQVRVANRNANFDQNDFINQPGAIWFYDHDTITPGQAVEVLKRQPVLQEIYREDSLMEDHINRVFGSTPNMQGQGLGGRATLGEAELVDARSGGRSDLISSQLAWQYELESAKDYLGMYTVFSEEPIEVQIDGEEASFPIEIFADEIDFEYDVTINAGEYGVLNSMQLNGLRETFGLVLSNPDAMFEIDPRLAISNFQHHTGMANILKPRAQAQGDRATAAQQAQIAAQASASGSPA